MGRVQDLASRTAGRSANCTTCYTRSSITSLRGSWTRPTTRHFIVTVNVVLLLLLQSILNVAINEASDDDDDKVGDKGKDDEQVFQDPEPDDSLVAQIDEQMQKLDLHLGKNLNTKMNQLMQDEQDEGEQVFMFIINTCL